jgi:hypothetical protein
MNKVILQQFRGKHHSRHDGDKSDCEGWLTFVLPQ